MAAVITPLAVTCIGVIKDGLGKERMSSDVLRELGMAPPVSLTVDPVLIRGMGPPGVRLTIIGMYGRNVARKGKLSRGRNVWRNVTTEGRITGGATQGRTNPGTTAPLLHR